MVKTMKIEGMMCGHCEARVKKALEAGVRTGKPRKRHGCRNARIRCERRRTEKRCRGTGLSSIVGRIIQSKLDTVIE